MRFLIVIIWAVLLSAVISYVLSSMADAPFEMSHALWLAGFLSVAIFVLGEGVLTETED